MRLVPSTRTAWAKAVTAGVRHHLALTDPLGYGVFIESFKEPGLSGLKINEGECTDLVETENALSVHPLPTVIKRSST
jgi:hypothetical protein